MPTTLDIQPGGPLGVTFDGASDAGSVARVLAAFRSVADVTVHVDSGRGSEAGVLQSVDVERGLVEYEVDRNEDAFGGAVPELRSTSAEDVFSAEVTLP
jgi:hypothetical protein